MSRSVTTPSPESVTIRLGKDLILRLRDLAMKESVRRMTLITTTELIKEALKNTFPAVVGE
jgi:hypothetical protein